MFPGGSAIHVFVPQERPRRFWAWANRLPDDRTRSSPAYTRSRMLKTDGSGQPLVHPDGHAGGGRRLDLSQLGAVVATNHSGLSSCRCVASDEGALGRGCSSRLVMPFALSSERAVSLHRRARNSEPGRQRLGDNALSCPPHDGGQSCQAIKSSLSVAACLVGRR